MCDRYHDMSAGCFGKWLYVGPKGEKEGEECMERRNTERSRWLGILLSQ